VCGIRLEAHLYDLYRPLNDEEELLVAANLESKPSVLAPDTNTPAGNTGVIFPLPPQMTLWRRLAVGVKAATI